MKSHEKSPWLTWVPVPFPPPTGSVSLDNGYKLSNTGLGLQWRHSVGLRLALTQGTCNNHVSKAAAYSCSLSIQAAAPLPAPPSKPTPGQGSLQAPLTQLLSLHVDTAGNFSEMPLV